MVPLQSDVLQQTGTLTAMLLREVAELLGLAIAVGAAATAVALVYRWYVRERVPTGLALLAGLTVVSLYLGTTRALGAVIDQNEEVLALQFVLPNLAAFAVGAAASYVGLRAGDRIGTDLYAATGIRDVDADVSEIVQTVGRVTAIRLPETVDDIVGYDPMPEATKETLANRRFLFPRRLTRDELRSRLVARLKTDYGVGHVDVDIDADGTVSYLAVGSRAAGIGPTLPPSTNAVAIRADPANAASTGDLVQVWQRDPAKRVLTGELRGVVGDVVTVAIDAADTPKLDPAEEYRLVTLPVDDRPDREFATLLRAADETMATVTVEAGSALDGATVASVDATVVAITADEMAPDTLPPSKTRLAAGEVLYLIGTPEALRSVEAAGEADADAADAQASAVTAPEPPAPAGESEEAGDAPTAPSDALRDRTAVEDTAAAAAETAETEGEESDEEGETDAESEEAAAVPADETTDGEVANDSEEAESDEEAGDEDMLAGEEDDEPAGEGDTPGDGEWSLASGHVDGDADSETEDSAADTDTDVGADESDDSDEPAEDFGAQDEFGDDAAEDDRGDDVGGCDDDGDEDDIDIDDLLSTSSGMQVWDPDEHLSEAERAGGDADDSTEADDEQPPGE